MFWESRVKSKPPNTFPSTLPSHQRWESGERYLPMLTLNPGMCYRNKQNQKEMVGQAQKPFLRGASGPKIRELVQMILVYRERHESSHWKIPPPYTSPPFLHSCWFMASSEGQAIREYSNRIHFHPYISMVTAASEQRRSSTHRNLKNNRNILKLYHSIAHSRTRLKLFTSPHTE